MVVPEARQAAEREACPPAGGSSHPGRALASDGEAKREQEVIMIKELSGMPAGVIGFEASGKMHAEDYRDVVLPALEHAAAAGEVRFVIVMHDFDGMSGSALWQDLKVGIEHWRAWKRIALVTDIEWMKQMTSLFGWMTPGEVKTFPLAQRDEAIEWAASSAS